MPNAPKTPMRTVRLDDALWSALGEAAAANRTDRSAVIRVLVLGYLRRHRRPQRPASVP